MKKALCPECGSALKGRHVCACGWIRPDEKTAPTASCSQCGHKKNSKDLKSSPTGDLCTTCFRVAQFDPADREYYRIIARDHNVNIVDVPTYLSAANSMGVTIEEYLKRVPRSRGAFRSYFENQPIVIGGVKL